ncbi:protein MARD1-like [Gossypium australe]|uniref:Protein MARD1-like n=1 Tax=Gossypium australe TaxID=47621 RepID=A0A5B6UME7_9ROSI|nr:protein MARD1-like [Gossypium australe]
MMLGKRSRQPIKRTTSMTGITVDVSDAEDVVEGHQDPIISHPPHPQIHPLHESPNANSRYDQRFLAMVSPRNPASFTSHVIDSSTTAAALFLRACWLCNRRLAPGRDIYMYRGDTAFCSQECREKQMKQDERKEKQNINASKKEDRHAHSSSTTTSSKTSKAKPVVAT